MTYADIYIPERVKDFSSNFFKKNNKIKYDRKNKICGFVYLLSQSIKLNLDLYNLQSVIKSRTCELTDCKIIMEILWEWGGLTKSHIILVECFL